MPSSSICDRRGGIVPVQAERIIQAAFLLHSSLLITFPLLHFFCSKNNMQRNLQKKFSYYFTIAFLLLTLQS